MKPLLQSSCPQHHGHCFCCDRFDAAASASRELQQWPSRAKHATILSAVGVHQCLCFHLGFCSVDGSCRGSAAISHTVDALESQFQCRNSRNSCSRKASPVSSFFLFVVFMATTMAASPFLWLLAVVLMSASRDASSSAVALRMRGYWQLRSYDSDSNSSGSMRRKPKRNRQRTYTQHKRK